MNETNNQLSLQSSYDDRTHFWGRLWSIVASVLIIAYPFVCMLLFGGSIDWTIVATGVGVVAMYWVVSVVETFTYTPMLGSGGTYLGFVTGNLSNLKVPCALNCMEQAEVKAGTEEGGSHFHHFHGGLFHCHHDHYHSRRRSDHLLDAAAREPNAATRV